VSWDESQQGLITPNTLIFDHITQSVKRDNNGHLIYGGKTTVYDFHSWRPSLAKLGKLELRTLGLKL
jgi:hypothetical protein